MMIHVVNGWVELFQLIIPPRLCSATWKLRDDLIPRLTGVNERDEVRVFFGCPGASMMIVNGWVELFQVTTPASIWISTSVFWCEYDAQALTPVRELKKRFLA